MTRRRHATAPAAALEAPPAPTLETLDRRARDVLAAMPDGLETPAQFRAAAEVLAAVVALREQVVGSFRGVRLATHDAHRRACAAQDAHEAPLAAAEDELRWMLGDYVLRDRQRRRAALADAVPLDLPPDAPFDALADRLAVPPPSAVPDVPGLTVAEDLVPVVDDAAAVPREYCAPDLAALRRAVRAAGEAAAIPGVRVVRRAVVRLRRAADAEPGA